MAVHPHKRPNVVIFICDDLAWGDLARHGNPVIHTPNLDRMYDESSHLTRYCSGPLCSPARVSLMTGRYHLRTRVLDTYCGRSMIDPDERTLAHALREAGYRTGAFGKWHLGDCYPQRAVDMGFEETLMHNAGGIGQPGDHPDNFARWFESSYFDPVLYHNGRPEQHRGYCTDVFTTAGLAFIEAHQHEPFFVYLATNAPHSPLLIDDKWAGRYRQMGINDTHARLYGMVENIDMNVGRVLAKLDELGLADNTIVLFTSDHGPCGSARNRSAPAGEQDRFNAGLRGIKGEMYEGGIRVPSLWRWPQRIAAGRNLDAVAHPIDILPTMLAACGVPRPTDRQIDGVDLLPLLSGEVAPDAWPDRRIFMQWHRGDVPIRYRNYAVITGQYKLTRPQHESRPDELYDLTADPFEQTDIASGRPDLVTQLRDAYDDWLDQMAATRGLGTFDPPPILLGVPQGTPTLLTQQDWRLIGEEGWARNDLRGYWGVQITRSGRYDIKVQFTPDVPAGVAHLRINEKVVTQAMDAGQTLYTFTGLELDEGPGHIEGWRELYTSWPAALYHRYVPALYLHVSGPQP